MIGEYILCVGTTHQPEGEIPEIKLRGSMMVNSNRNKSAESPLILGHKLYTWS